MTTTHKHLLPAQSRRLLLEHSLTEPDVALQVLKSQAAADRVAARTTG